MKRKIIIINFIKLKKYIGILTLVTTSIIIAMIYMNINISIATREEITSELKDEKKFVIMTATLAKAQDSNNKISITKLAQELNRYTGIGKTSVTEKDSKTLLVTFIKTGNEYEIDIDKGFYTSPVTYYVDTNRIYTEEVVFGEDVINPTTFIPAKEGWTFIGWKEDENANTDVLTEKTMEGKPINLYAVYQKDIYLSYDGNGATGGSTETQSAKRYFNASGNYQDPTFTLSECGFTKTDYAFKGWNLGAAGEQITLTSDANAKALWRITRLDVLSYLGTGSIYRAGENSTWNSRRFDITAFNKLTVNCGGGQNGGGGSYSCTLVTIDGNISLLGNKTIDISGYTGEAYISIYTSTQAMSGWDPSKPYDYWGQINSYWTASGYVSLSSLVLNATDDYIPPPEPKNTLDVLEYLGLGTVYKAGTNSTWTSEKFDITNFNKLVVTCDYGQTGGGGSYSCNLVTTSGTISLLGTKAVEIGSYTGEAYITIYTSKQAMSGWDPSKPYENWGETNSYWTSSGYVDLRSLILQEVE